MKWLDIFEMWQRVKKGERNKYIVKRILEEYDMTGSEDPPRALKMFVSSLNSKLSSKWEKCKRTKSRFLADNEVWLREEVSFPPELLSIITSFSETDKPRSSRIGRPEKMFEECNLKVKKRKLKDLVSSKTQEELTLATEMKLMSSGKRDAAKIVKEVSLGSPARATNLRKAKEKSARPEPKLSPEAALGLMIDAKLSVEQYNIIRQLAKSVNSNLYPPYYLIKEAKSKCYPQEDSITVSDSSAEVQLQPLLDLTIKRICEAQEVVIEQSSTSESSLQCQLISKWGCDGSSAQSRYKQKLCGEDSEYSDENLFSISLVPLRLIHVPTSNILWQNPRPNSTRFCRMVRFSFRKETQDVIKSEVNQMKAQIANLVPSNIKINNAEVDCTHLLVFSMVDGKICNTLSQYDSTQKCYICGKTPKEMMSTEESSTQTADEDMYSFGISPLHSWIRAFECLLHISYKLNIKKWQARTKEDKESVAFRKAHIQKRFKNELGLLVDMPKQTAGNTNDGNTARRFFRNPELSADITGIDIQLIRRFLVILETISCELEIDAERFQLYAEETRKLYFEHYSWYYLPPSIHKILVHSKKIIESCILPLGQLAEEAQEANNKEYRRNREYFSRKTSRKDTNKDVLNRFLLASDPLLSCKSQGFQRKRHKLPTETITLLKAPDVIVEVQSDE